MFLVVSFISQLLFAERIKDISTISTIRTNHLLGAGIVANLEGKGDSSTEVISNALARALGRLGLESTGPLKSKNMAAVMVTAELHTLSKKGQKINCKVSSIGDASSLKGGQLLLTPLRAGDTNVYAVAQGTINENGEIIAGATIEKEIDLNLFEQEQIRLILKNPDITTAARIEWVINNELSGQFARAKDAAMIDLMVPWSYRGNGVGFMALVENFLVYPDNSAKIVINEKTGTVIIGEAVRLAPVAISHGDLSIKINSTAKKGQSERISSIRSSNLQELVASLNKLGTTPKDLIAIFFALKESGALSAELRIL